MLSASQLAHQLVQTLEAKLGTTFGTDRSAFAEVPEASPAEAASSQAAEQPRLDTKDPVEHLRRAIASTRGSDATKPDAKLYSELRLLLNQLESGRISTQLTQTIERVRPAAVVPVKRRGLRALLRRKAQAAVKRVLR